MKRATEQETKGVDGECYADCIWQHRPGSDVERECGGDGEEEWVRVGLAVGKASCSVG